MQEFLTNRKLGRNMGERHSIAHKRVFVLLIPEIPQLEMAKMQQKPTFTLPGCHLISVNTYNGLREGSKPRTIPI